MICYLIGEALPLLSVIAALIIGKSAWNAQKKALFPKLVAAGLGCMALGYLHDMVYYLIMGELARGIYVSFLGIMGCFLFLLSANYGQLDRLFDDGDKSFCKYRWLSLIAPAVIIISYLPVALSDSISFYMKCVGFLGWLVIAAASYYNLKHAIISDGGFSFVKAVRPYNFTAVILEVSQVCYLSARIFDIKWAIVVTSVFLSASLILLMYYAEKGATKWTL